MNWGYRLLMVFIVFGLGMGYLIYRSMHTEFDLVEKDYYATELRYQQVIDDTRNADALSTPLIVAQEQEGIRVVFPSEMKAKPIEGEIWIYCAYDRKNDRRIKVEANEEGIQLIPAGLVRPGTYTLKISWKENNRGYYSEKILTVS